MVKLNDLKRGALTAVLWTLGLISTANAAESLTNGSFETDWTNGWTLGNAQNSYGTIQNQTASGSPFLNVNPAGTQAVQMTAGANSSGNGWGPSMYQSISAHADYAFSFEFSLPDVTTGSPWQISLDKIGSPVISFMIGGFGGYGSSQSGHISYATVGYGSNYYTDIGSLTAGVWYQMTTVINVTQGTFSGALTAYQGATVNFSGALQPGAGNGASVGVGSTGSATGSVLYLDNVSLRTVPEPGVSILILAGLAVSFVGRRRRHFLA